MFRIKNWFQCASKKDDDSIESEELTSLDEEGREMVRGIVELSDTPIKEVMIPRIDTVFVPEDSNVGESLMKMMESGHSRFPVYRGTIDHVVGILHVKDLLPLLVKEQNIVIPKAVRPAYFVPESMKLDSLLREMKQRRIHIAVAVDEYGGVSGIISMEDILEKIVGDIQDEFDNEGEDLVALDNDEWLCDARINLTDLNEALQSNIPDEDFDTLGGFVFDLFGKIPDRHDRIAWNDFIFCIQSLEGHKICKVKIIKEKKNLEN